MNTIKKLMLIGFFINQTASFAQENTKIYEKTQGYINVGFARPFLQGGKELTRAEDLRNDELSYFENNLGQRKNVGSYPANAGWQISLGFYKPIKFVPRLLVGANATSCLTGSQPEKGGYEEGYFFNYLSAGLGAKYYPMATNNFFLKIDGGMGAVFTKNRFINAANEQNFFHQFGIGSSFSGGLGYTFTPFKNKNTGIELGAMYQQYSTRVEVNGIGNDQWQFGSLNLQIGFVF